MGYKVGIFLFFIGIIVTRGKRNKVTPLSFYVFWWGLLSFLSALKLHDTPEGSLFVYFLIVFATVSFSLGYGLGYKKKYIDIGRRRIEYFRSKALNEINSTIVNIIGGVSALFLLQFVARAFLLYRSGYQIGLVRQIYWRVGGGIVNNALEYFILHQVIGTVVIWYECILALYFVNREKKIAFYVIFAVLIVENIFISGGRMIIVDIISMILFTMILQGRIIKISFTTKLKMITLTGAAAFVVITITLARQSTEHFLFTTWQEYTMSIPFMSYLFNGVYKGELTFGYVFFRGFLDIVFTFLAFLHIPAPSVASLLSKYTTPFYRASSDVVFNAYTSHIFYFYMDAHLPGVIIGCVLFGMICGRIYRNYIEVKSNYNLVKLLLVFNIIYYTFYQWKFASAPHFLAFTFVWLLFKKNENEET